MRPYVGLFSQSVILLADLPRSSIVDVMAVYWRDALHKRIRLVFLPPSLLRRGLQHVEHSKVKARVFYQQLNGARSLRLLRHCAVYSQGRCEGG